MTYIQQRFSQKRSLYPQIYDNQYTLSRNLIYRIWLFNNALSYTSGEYLVNPYSITNLPDQVLPSTSTQNYYAQAEMMMDIYRGILDLDIGIRKRLHPWKAGGNSNLSTLIDIIGSITLDISVPSKIAEIRSALQPLYLRAAYLKKTVGDIVFSSEDLTVDSLDGGFSVSLTTQFFPFGISSPANLSVYIENLEDNWVVSDDIIIRPYPYDSTKEFTIRGRADSNGNDTLPILFQNGVEIDPWEAEIGTGGYATTITTADDMPRSFAVELPWISPVPNVASSTLYIIVSVNDDYAVIPIGSHVLSPHDQYMDLGNIFAKISSNQCNVEEKVDNITLPYFMDTIHAILFGSLGVVEYPTPPLPLSDIFRLLISDTDIASDNGKIKFSHLSINSGVLFIYDLLFRRSSPYEFFPTESGYLSYPTGVYDTFRDAGIVSSDRGMIVRSPLSIYQNFVTKSNTSVSDRLLATTDIDHNVSIIDGYLEAVDGLDKSNQEAAIIETEFANARKEATPVGQALGVANAVGSVPPALIGKLNDLQSLIHKLVQSSSTAGVIDSTNTMSLAERYLILRDLADRIGMTKFGITSDDIWNFAKSNHTNRILRIFRDILAILSLKEAVDNIVSNAQFKGVNNIAVGSNGAQNCTINVPIHQANLLTTISLDDFFNANPDIYPKTLIPYTLMICPLDKSSSEGNTDTTYWKFNNGLFVHTEILVAENVSMAGNAVAHVFTINNVNALPNAFQENDGLVGMWFKGSTVIPSRGSASGDPQYMVTNYSVVGTTGTVTYIGSNGAILQQALTFFIYSSGEFTIDWQNPNSSDQSGQGTWTTYSWIAVRSDIVGATNVDAAQYLGVYEDPPSDEDLMNFM